MEYASGEDDVGARTVPIIVAKQDSSKLAAGVMLRVMICTRYHSRIPLSTLNRWRDLQEQNSMDTCMIESDRILLEVEGDHRRCCHIEHHRV